MDELNRQDFVQALDELTAFYEAFPISRDIWWRALSKYSLEAVIAGFEAHITDPEHGLYPPKPAHIIRHIDRLYPRRSGCYKPYVPLPEPERQVIPMIAPAFCALTAPNAQFTPLYWEKYREGFNKHGLRGPALVAWAKAQATITPAAESDEHAA